MWEAHIRRGLVVLAFPSEIHIGQPLMGHERIKPPVGGNQVISVISLKVLLEAISSHFLNQLGTTPDTHLPTPSSSMMYLPFLRRFLALAEALQQRRFSMRLSAGSPLM